jgi:hypothetical protein
MLEMHQATKRKNRSACLKSFGDMCTRPAYHGIVHSCGTRPTLAHRHESEVLKPHELAKTPGLGTLAAMMHVARMPWIPVTRSAGGALLLAPRRPCRACSTDQR